MTAVRFPTRIVVEIADDRTDEPEVADLIEEAAAEAIHRAVERAMGLDLVRAALPDPFCRPRIDVSFSGDALPATTTREIHRRVAGAAAAEAARMSARAGGSGATAGLRALMPADTSGRGEPFADDRLVTRWDRPDGDRYRVPSYSGHGAATQVAVGNQGEQPHIRTQTFERLRAFSGVDDLQLAIMQRYGGHPPALLVAAVRGANDVPTGLAVTVDATGRISVVSMGPWLMYSESAGERSAATHAWQVDEADLLRFVWETTSDEERRRIRRDEIVRKLRAGLLGHERMTDEQRERYADRLVAQLPPATGTTRYYYVMSRGSIVTLIEVANPPIPARDIPVALFTETVTVTEDGQVQEPECPGLPLEQVLIFNPDPDHPFLAEPPVEWWPSSLAMRIENLIDAVARPLNMTAGRFPGMFLAAAATEAGRQARSLGSLVGSGEGSASPRAAALATLGSAVEAMEELQYFYTRVIAGADEGRVLPCPLRGHSASWLGHFYEGYFPLRNRTIAHMFVAGCQDILLGVLESSARELERRTTHFHAYMAVARTLIRLLLVDVTELTDLRQTLVDQSNETTVATAVVSSGGAVGAWYQAARAVVTLLEQPQVETSGPPQRGRIAQFNDGSRIQDSTGRWWSRTELDSVIAGGREQAFGVDPLLEKVADLPDVVQRLRNAGADGIDDEFLSLLAELQTENTQRTAEVRNDMNIAFKLAGMREAEITSASSIGAQLSGIHAQADTLLRPMFTGRAESAYVEAMRSLVASELGYEDLTEFFNIVGLTAIAIMCPPAAFLIGGAEAIYGLSQASEHMGIQRAMLGGDDILTKAQAEAEMWGAAIGAALVFLPEVPGIVRGVRGGVRAVVAGEVREAAVLAGRQAMRAAATHLAEMAARDLAVVFVRDCLTGDLLNMAIGGAMRRITDAVQHEVQVTGHADIADLSRILMAAVAGQPANPGGAQ